MGVFHYDAALWDVTGMRLARISHQLSSRSATRPRRGLVETLRRLGDKARAGRAPQAYLTVRRGARPSATQLWRMYPALQQTTGEKCGLARG